MTRHLGGLREEAEPGGIIYECGTFKGTTSGWQVAVAELGLSKGDTASHLGRALEFFAPELALFVGTAFGLRSRYEDVVVATHVVPFGSDDPGRNFDPLPGIEIASPRLEHRARFEGGKEAWKERVFGLVVAPDVHVADLAVMVRGSVAAGSPWLEFLESYHPAVRAVAVGFYDVFRLLGASSIDALAIHGIVGSIHPAESIKSVFSRREVAADVAAAFAFQILAKLGSATTQPQRSSRPTESPASQYVTRLAIENIRSITTATWEVDEPNAVGWHVILGDNGSGKSTFLRALALTLFNRTDMDALRQDWATWLRLGAHEGSAMSTLVRTDRNGKDVRKQMSLDLGTQVASFDRVVRLSRALEADAASDGTAARGVTCAPEASSSDAFSVAYGPFRRFSGGDIDFEKEFVAHPRLTRHLSLFSERAALTEGLAWLKDLRFKQLEHHPDGELLDTIRDFINESSLLPQGARLAEVSSEAVTFTDGNGCTLPIEELSDGFRSILSLTLDLLRHFATAYDPAELFSSTDRTRVVAPGIVLIDEIDAHLHPTWQHAVGRWFREHFPNVQFIVATHSPLICQAADTVFLLPRPGSGDSGRMLAGIELERVRHGNVLDAYGTGVFGDGVTRSEESKQMLRRLAELNAKELETELTPEEESEQDRLRAILPTSGGQATSVETNAVQASSGESDGSPGAA